MLLKKLIETPGVSGQENEVRDLIREELKGHVDSIDTDKLGNIIAYKKGRREGRKILLSAHMDEIGLIVTKINDDGCLKFTKAGSFDDRILVSKIVSIGKDKLTGVIGAKPIHLQKAAERKDAIPVNSLYIDIGVASKEEASKHVKIGDYVSLVSETKDFGGDLIKGKALDSRVPCAMLIDILKGDLEYSVTASFTVMEKVHVFGARCVGNRVNPDYAIVIGGTHGEVGKGPIVNVKELRAVFDRELIKDIGEIASERDVKIQLVSDEVNMTGGDFYQIASEGCKVARLSVPCKYINTPVNLVSKRDIEDTKRVIEQLVVRLGGREDEF